VTAILSNGSIDMLQSAVKGREAARRARACAFGRHRAHLQAGRRSYDLVIDTLGKKLNEISFNSSNRCDVAGAANAGLKPAWVNRAGNPDEYPGLNPVTTVYDLGQLAELSL